MRIGELARAAEAKVETVRYYERLGLLGAPMRSRANYRLYGKADLERLRFIRRARSLGFSLDEVRRLLALAEDGGMSCEAIDDLARTQRDAIDRKIADLQILRRELNGLLQSCPSSVVAECRIIEALATSRSA